MTGRRPRVTKPDRNQRLVSDLFAALGYTWRGLPVILFDTHNFGGRWLDWLVWIGAYALMVEVKAETNPSPLTEGERATLASGIPACVVHTAQELEVWLYEHTLEIRRAQP